VQVSGRRCQVPWGDGRDAHGRVGSVSGRRRTCSGAYFHHSATASLRVGIGGEDGANMVGCVAELGNLCPNRNHCGLQGADLRSLASSHIESGREKIS
jgi:hypothetical protein